MRSEVWALGAGYLITLVISSFLLSTIPLFYIDPPARAFNDPSYKTADSATCYVDRGTLSA